MDINKSGKIILISSGQPSLNPRLVKEADVLADAGYQVTVLYAYWNDWGTRFDEQLLASKKWKAMRVGGDPKQKRLSYFFSRLIHKTAKQIVQRLGTLSDFTEIAASRSSYYLMREAKKHQADLFIGHNLGALAATVRTAKKQNAKCGFDAEDFHRQELSDDQDSIHFKTAKYLEDKYLPKLNYMTASSSQIAGFYEQLYPGTKPVTILNVFARNSNIKQRSINATRPIRLFWFSQTIGVGRGINTIAKALELLKEQDFELHLLGHISAIKKQVFIDNELGGIKNVFFHEPIPQDEFTNFAAQFDIGLALEPGFCMNNDIALSNKIFTYLQAGLGIVASDTKAQKWFLDRYSKVGSLYQNNDTQSLAAILSSYQLDRKKLFDTREASLKLGRKHLNWQNESKKFLRLVELTLNSN